MSRRCAKRRGRISIYVPEQPGVTLLFVLPSHRNHHAHVNLGLYNTAHPPIYRQIKHCHHSSKQNGPDVAQKGCYFETYSTFLNQNEEVFSAQLWEVYDLQLYVQITHMQATEEACDQIDIEPVQGFISRKLNENIACDISKYCIGYQKTNKRALFILLSFLITILASFYHVMVWPLIVLKCGPMFRTDTLEHMESLSHVVFCDCDFVL